MRLLFLDIDGVLNSQLFYEKTIQQKKKELRKRVKREEIERRDYHLAQIDPLSVSFLNSIIETTGAKVVLSSSWRIGNSTEYMQSLLMARGFIGELIGRTPYLGEKRGFEIDYYLKNCGFDVEQYVILDDDSDMTTHQLQDHFIWVDRYCGISPTTIWKASRILNGETIGQFMRIEEQS